MLILVKMMNKKKAALLCYMHKSLLQDANARIPKKKCVKNSIADSNGSGQTNELSNFFQKLSKKGISINIFKIISDLIRIPHFFFFKLFIGHADTALTHISSFFATQ